MDSASNTYTIDISGAEPAGATTSGGGASVTAQYELSAEVPIIKQETCSYHKAQKSLLQFSHDKKY